MRIADVWKPQHTQFQGQRQIWTFRKNRRVDPQVDVIFLWGKFRFLNIPPALGVHMRKNFKKILCRMEKSSLPKFQLSEWYICEMGPKTKKGETKNWKSVLGGR